MTCYCFACKFFDSSKGYRCKFLPKYAELPILGDMRGCHKGILRGDAPASIIEGIPDEKLVTKVIE